ncbi:MAG TPA: aldo/keto reductase [Polyangiaceae bacterium]|nr:aldo/keto reductase [Polyangiaceae bacterium]
MRRRALGATGIDVSEIALGTWGLSGDGYGALLHATVKRTVLERARAMGITLFETAQNYANGAMESDLGEVLGDDAEAVIVTKWGTDRSTSIARKRFDVDYIKQSLDSSRARLGKKARIIALLHNPSERALADGKAMETLKEMTQAGDLASWGVSVGSEASARLALGAQAPVLSFAYNVLIVQPLRAVSTLLTENNTGVLAHSVLFYGLLTGQWGPTKRFVALDHRSERWTEATLISRIRHLDAIRPLVSGEVTSLRSAALRFVLNTPQVHSAILGPRSAGQLDQMVRDLSGELPYLSEGKLSALESRLQTLEVAR